MFYYQFNIGDYATHTRHLSIYADIAYRRLLDWYYLNEKPIPSDSHQAAKLILMKNRTHDVEEVLKEFFKLTENGWINNRADLELAKYKEFSEAGKRGAAKRWSKGAHSPPIAPLIANKNQEPITNNHKPITIKPDSKTLLATLGITDSLAEDFIKLRSAKKSPITETALKGICREASKANLTALEAVQIMCERGWAGFKSEWLKEKINGNQDARLETARQIFGGSNGIDRQTIDITPTISNQSYGEGFPEIDNGIWESNVE